MADELKHSTTISKKDPGFPDYLDFDALRSQGIEYVGKLAGQIWTDHNVHDPGITILEMLCYALLDLGYRTQLPLDDILARNPNDQTPDNNFFTPAHILACNPLTMTDFRKLLIDLKGVRNAWLEPAADITDFCRRRQQHPGNVDDQGKPCESFLNGLYHVYLDLEKNIDSYGGIHSDFKDKAQADAYREAVLKRVKKALMAHRNLCEDFADIYILCKLPMGVCAEIELEEGVKAEEVYVSVVNELRIFFTPTPRFYTLQQLLEKEIPVEEIFAGRPFDHTHSHGFVDVEEFEALELKKEIHLSDVYHVLLKIHGVSSVRNLSLRLCNGGPGSSDWKFGIKKNHIPEFSPRCSGFRFTRNSMPITVDVKKYQRLFDLNFSHSGKILYQSPSPYLDLAIPKGVYRSDLSDYYSVQNEFPRVYAIEEGGLADDAPDYRKAQALQLKGYLLFFDQLLANYLTQLSNLRSLFAVASPESEKQQHTYFINQLDSVPELQKLLRFPATEKEKTTGQDPAGGTLVFPVDKNNLLALRDSNQLKYFDLEKAAPLVFASQAEKDTEVSQLKEDLFNGVCTHECITKTDGCVFYFILTSSDKMALISKKYFRDVTEAREHADSVTYIGVFEENYRSFVDQNHRFSFTLEMSLASFSEYLQLLMEDRKLYLDRRQGFLQHLLARFSEKFTDYALLSFGNSTSKQSEESNIKATERFLSQYDDISSNRGKAYDYWSDGWHNDNVSGFEKRVKALSGMENWKRNSLCNFEVNRYDEQYAVTLKIGDREFFSLRKTYDSPEEGQQAAQALFTSLSEREGYVVQPVPLGQAYVITIGTGERTLGTYREQYDTEEEARTGIQNLHRLFSGNPASPREIFASGFTYHLQLRNYRDEVVLTSAERYETKAVARLVSTQLKQGVNDDDRWQAEGETSAPAGTLFRIPRGKPPRFIDLNAFKFDLDNTLADKPDSFSYDLLDKRNRFKFRPHVEFDSPEQAQEHWRQLLAWMANAENYTIVSDEDTRSFILHITVNDEDKAVCSERFSSEKEARRALNEILTIIRRNVYALTIQKVPQWWKFIFRLGIGRAGTFMFESIEEYEGSEEALAAAEGFEKSISTLQVWKYGEGFKLVPVKTQEDTSSVKLTQSFETEEAASLRAAINRELSLQKEVNRLLEESRPTAFAASVDLDDLSKRGLFVYRLVDKDTVPACYSESFDDPGSAKDSLKALRAVDCEAYSALELCLGGNIFSERTAENSPATWYHYHLRSLSFAEESGNELILFESVQGYPTRYEAEKAFSENYLHILELASHPENYGATISLEEKRVHKPAPSSSNEPIVFVPRETRDHWGEDTTQQLASLARSYPIRVVADQSESFYRLFPCEDRPEKQEERICKPAEEKFVYYFRLYGTGYQEEEEEENKGYWLSTGYFETPGEARSDYRFFRMLLCYPGNFFVRCDPCSPYSPAVEEPAREKYRICLREVLAESTARFESEEEAWGKEGVQKFICISQSERGFHPYWRKRGGCYSFYLACADSVVYHPCRYDTSGKRDRAIEKLIREIHERHTTGAWHYGTEQKEGEVYILKNETGIPFGRIETGHEQGICRELILFLEKVRQRKIEYAAGEDGAFHAYDRDRETGLKVQAVDMTDPDQWRETLEAFACYHPIVRQRGEKGDKYCIEITLPGFSSCEEKTHEDGPCGCNGKEEQPGPDCYVAWKSRCCFDSCEEAEEALKTYTSLLLDHNNYRPLFACDCYEFGIALHYNNLEGVPEIVSREKGVLLSDSEMVALNPQCYSTPAEGCAAIERAWKLINAEGLHMAEHILLRPRCPEDCNCEQYSASCENETGCEFVWHGPDEDPCDDRPDVCFIPGADPYSFIATVALPAWPARFRKPENRRLLEHILYREAPAHVLLRILWLAPHDFCCFESKYKQWLRWLARKETCREDFSNCDFLEFLFNRNYECLEECDGCLPCEEETTEPDFCSPNWSEEPMGDPYEFLNQVNELYCWREQHCEEYQFIPCRNEVVIEEDHDGDDVILLSHQTGEEADDQADDG